MRLRAALVLVLLAPLFAAPAAAQDAADTAARLRRLAPLAADEVLWLARCLYTESDRAEEQRYVAWVVRNRVETAYRGRTYREVVLETKQFSAFNAPSPRRDSVLAWGPGTPRPSWQQALRVALRVYEAPASERPFPVTVRHFYSPVSMPGGATPPWAVGRTPLDNGPLGVDPHRFRFYDGLDTPAGAAYAGIGAAALAPSVGAAPAASEAAPAVRVVRPAPRRLLGQTRSAVRVERPTRPSVTRPTRAGGTDR